jgi:hypothetical protein
MTNTDSDLFSNTNKAKYMHEIFHDLVHMFDDAEFSQQFLTEHMSVGELVRREVLRLAPIPSSTSRATENAEITAIQVLIAGLLFLLSLSLAERFASLALITSCASADRPHADYMIRYQAGASLAYLATDLASILEKNTSLDYELAVCIYELLLALPYMEHRRGKWYIRLCVDYEHMKLVKMAHLAAQRGLQDLRIMVTTRSCPITLPHGISSLLHMAIAL